MYIQIFADINFVAAEYCVLVECLYTNMEIRIYHTRKYTSMPTVTGFVKARKPDNTVGNTMYYHLKTRCHVSLRKCNNI